MPWSNPGPAKQVLIVGQSGDELVYDGQAFLGHPYGNLIAAVSGVNGTDQFGDKFWAGLSLAASLSFSINDSQVDAHGQILRFVDGLLNAHLQMKGPGLTSPKGILDFDSNGVATFGNDTGDTGFSFNSAGGASIFTKSGTSIVIGGSGSGHGIVFGVGTSFAQLFIGIRQTYTIGAGVNSQTTTVTFPGSFSFAGNPAVFITPVVGSNFDHRIDQQPQGGSSDLTSFMARATTPTLANTGAAQAGAFNWLAIGT